MISVALCTYNGEKYIREQLDSILAQTMPVDEIVVCDDISQDATWAILSEYASRYPQIRLFQNETNKGCRKNFEQALRKCQGDYIFFSDQDDIWVQDKVAVMVDYLERTGKCGVFSDGQFIDGAGAKMENWSLFYALNLKDYIQKGYLDKYALEILCLKGNYVTGAAFAITKSAKELVLPITPSRYVMHDTCMAVKLAACHQLGYIERPLISYRIHSSQTLSLDFRITGQREPLYESLESRGDCSELLAMRRYSSIPVHYCHLGRDARNQLFQTYQRLYSEALPSAILARIKYRTLFLLNELYVCFRRQVGYKE